MMESSNDSRKMIDEWFKEFSEDEDQISISIDVIDDGYLQLSCGTGVIIFSFDVSGPVSQLLEISSNGSDKFVDELAARCNNAFKLNMKHGDMSTASANVQRIDLMSVLQKFSEISKDMAAHSNRLERSVKVSTLRMLIRLAIYPDSTFQQHMTWNYELSVISNAFLSMQPMTNSLTKICDRVLQCVYFPS